MIDYLTLHSPQTWDDEVALMAQTHAQQCVFVHDSNRDVCKLAYYIKYLWFDCRLTK